MIRTASSASAAAAALAVALGALAPSARAAEPAATAGRAVTLDEALRLATRNSLDLRAARARLDQSQVQVETAWASLLPTLAAQGKYTHNYREVTLDFAAQLNQPFVGLATAAQVGAPAAQAAALEQFKTALSSVSSEPIVIQKGEQLDGVASATVPLIVPSAWYQLRAARQSAASADAAFAVTRAQVLLAVAQAFFVAAGTDEVLAAQRHGVEVAGKTLADAKAKVAAGTANRVELTRAQVAWERAEQRAEEAAAQRANAYRGLATAAGIEGEFHVDPGQLPADRFTEGEDLGTLALKLRPEFLQAERSIASGEASSDAALWRWAPSLSAFGNVRGFNYAGFSGDKYAWAVGLQLDWILYDGGARDAQRHLANAQVAEARARYDLLHLTVRDDIENARRNVAVRRRAVETATHAVQLSRETLDLVRVQHDAGTATQLDLLSAQDALIESERQLAQARFDLALTDLTLQKQVGTFPAADLVADGGAR